MFQFPYSDCFAKHDKYRNDTHAYCRHFLCRDLFVLFSYDVYRIQTCPRDKSYIVLDT